MRNPRNDMIFKKIFTEDRNKNFLKKVLKDAFELDSEIQELDFCTQEVVDGRSKFIVDLEIKDEKGHKFLVEMQISRDPSCISRGLCYFKESMRRILTGSLEKYDLKTSKILAICTFNLFPKTSDLQTNHKIVDAKNGTTTTEAIEMCFVELPKIRKNIEKFSNNIEKLAYFLTAYDSDKLIEMCEHDADLLNLRTSLGLLDLSKAEAEAYELSKWDEDL